MMKYCKFVILLIIACTFLNVQEANGSCSVTQDPIKLLVPLYVYPGAAWNQVMAGASQVPTIAIINPSSGPSTPNSDYTNYMNQMNSVGVEMIGYVHTSYGSRPISEITQDIDTWAANYPHINGFFFDEASSEAADISYYQQAYNYATQKGYTQIILNPGTQPDQGYFAVSTSIVVFENEGDAFSSVACASGNKYQYAAIAHSSASSSAPAILSSMQSKGMGLVYVTDGAAGCCTYNQLTSYYANEISSIRSDN
jgi:hypothetical protein